MHANLVPLHILRNDDRGPLNDARADDEEGGLEVHLVEVVEEFPKESGWENVWVSPIAIGWDEKVDVGAVGWEAPNFKARN
jgi:hypothetical protein